MTQKFMRASKTRIEKFDWGEFAWISQPRATGARQLVVCHVVVYPGKGHNFHKHPEQEEVIYILEGKLEQWLKKEKKILGPGDSVFIPRNTVHASFNTSQVPVKVMAILGPCIGAGGYQLVDVSGKSPWNKLRGDSN